MKISHRIIFINFIVVALVLGTAAIAFYSIMYNALTTQQSLNLLNSTRNFTLSYRALTNDAEEEFFTLRDKGNDRLFEKPILTGTINDFFFESNPINEKLIDRHSSKSGVVIPNNPFTIDDFIKHNPYASINSIKDKSNKVFYFGRILNSDFINNFSQRISADIALIWDNYPSEISNAGNNNEYSFLLSQAFNSLKQKGEFDVFTGETDDADIIASVYRIERPANVGNDLSFLIFKSHNEASDLRRTLRTILILIGIVGIIIALLLTYILTYKLRERISDLSIATAQTSSGNFTTRIKVKSNDEIAKLGKAFNLMMDELEKNQRTKNEYSEFITLINRNPSLAEISNAALKKIIDTCGFLIGALYSIDEGEVSLISSYGISKKDDLLKERNEFYKRIISTKEPFEIASDSSLPTINTGIVDLRITHLLMIPVIYNNKVIAIIELGSIANPSAESRDYLSKIQEQLAIGLTNAKAVVQLENFVSELKKLNDEYHKQNIQIKKQNETLLELSNQLKTKAEELAIQKEKAEESTKLKSQFLASMSHELRTPMNSILGLTELILEKAQLSGKNKERLEVVLNSGRRLMSLINDILDLSKIEADKMEIRDEDILLEELIEEVSSTITPLALDKGLNFNIQKKCNTRVIINTDRGRVTQVLINLLGNAIKFTGRGKVELIVSFTDDRMLKLSVIDTGIGISKENQRVIFEEFRQLDGTTTRKYSGTGLGLAICKKIIDLLGGKIWVDSTEGRGSTFSFTIPIKYVHEKSKDEAQPVNVETLRKNIRNPILVIDDDSEIRYTIGQYLISKGYEVIFAEDGDTGIRLAVENQPFAITLDVMLPKRDGWSILKELKENPATKDIPVILVSIIGDKNVGYGLGAFEYFVKPISADKLLSAFNRLESLAKKRIQKIVIVDDDELEFEKFKHEFKDEDIKIEYIQDSEFAFNKIAEVQPDLIILDLMMPKIDGVTLSHKLKSNIKTKHIPIIISTAKDLNSEERQSLTTIVEDITVKSKGHPLDVLKIVRDRIKLHESYDSPIYQNKNIKVNSTNVLVFEDEIKRNVFGEVLIVDDDADTLFTLNEMVQATGCRTHLAKSGIECLKILEHVKPDLILLDIMMPEMDGFQTLKNIRANNELAEIPVFAVTAKAMAGDKEVILKYGFNDYIPKPVNTNIISSKIGQLFSKIKTS